MSASTAESTNISASAGDDRVLSNPNSPEAIARRAAQIQAQSSADKQYDATAAKDAFTDYIIVWEKSDKRRSKEISAAIFLTLGTMLFLYKAAPDSF